MGKRKMNEKEAKEKYKDGGIHPCNNPNDFSNGFIVGEAKGYLGVIEKVKGLEKFVEIFSNGCVGHHSLEDGECCHCEAKTVLAQWEKER